MRHNPEFTMVEFYQAYADFRDLMVFTEDMLREIALAVFGSTKISYQGQPIDLAKSYLILTMEEALVKYNPALQGQALRDLSSLQAYARRLEIRVEDGFGAGKLQYEIFEKTVERELQEPTFIISYPVEVSPLARPNDRDSFLSDRFELFIGGREIANGFSELNDPQIQEQIFRQQARAFQEGDQEAMHYDADYIVALEHGMPPTAGEGIGIDRLVMLFMDIATIRDVILFPLLRAIN